MNTHIKTIALSQTFPPALAPTKETCYALWEKYEMPEHIRHHSTLVAAIATNIAQKLAGTEHSLCVNSVTVSALLHDIAKKYCIDNGGKHNVIGAYWVLEETQNPSIAQGVYFHNYLDPSEVTLPKHFLPVIVMYADSRVQHTEIVSLTERYQDLAKRYGSTQEIRNHIALVEQQAVTLEHMLEHELGCTINSLLPIPPYSL